MRQPRPKRSQVDSRRVIHRVSMYTRAKSRGIANTGFPSKPRAYRKELKWLMDEITLSQDVSSRLLETTQGRRAVHQISVYTRAKSRRVTNLRFPNKPKTQRKEPKRLMDEAVSSQEVSSRLQETTQGTRVIHRISAYTRVKSRGVANPRFPSKPRT